MRKIKVYLQSPWKFSDSSYYKFLLDNPPKNVEYFGTLKKKRGIIENKKKIAIYREVKETAKKILKKMKLSFVNAHLSKNIENYDLIHNAHCLSLNKKPWVADIEWHSQFSIPMDSKNPQRKKIRKILMNKYCKKIMPWTKIVEKNILKQFPEIKNKVEVVYPGIPAPKFKKVKSKKIRLLFLSRFFYTKGGLHALEVFNRLSKKYDNIELKFISRTPKEILKKYSKNKKIIFSELIPQKELFEKVYPRTDILVYPAYVDSFGFAITEALSFGIPVVSVGGSSREELITNGETGFIIPKPKNLDYQKIGKTEEEVINKIIEKTSKLIENKKLREKMSKAARQEIEIGKFSIEKRNEKLKRIYNEALKDNE